ncbi:MAG TPA: ABC transporter ATP-binding protein [Xanthobacteraceae bacterium]|jgi:iron(III) transport system ATP-binding protein|nr:ABC transporter ATP-binding protein [Xanthobacteraceae bacterium]
MPDLIIEKLFKRYGNNEILKGVSLSMREGEVIALLGHSGSGKTTILRSVAGLETPNGGRITLGGQTLFDAENNIDMPPEQRGLGLVFQSYALWPNRTVFDNVAYGLKLRKTDTATIKAKVDRILTRLGLGGLGDRYPHQLSGGQQQRVALARAIVYEPPILLLDEPLSNLDAKLREEARSWLRELILQVRISALYVTHDQVEAMAVADRILFLRDGQIEQAGPPQEMYEQPRTAIAADFMGSNNRFEGTIGTVENGRARLDGQGWSLWGTPRASLPVGAKATGYVRLERTRLTNSPGPHRLAMQLSTSLYLGERWEHLLTLGDLRVRLWGDHPLKPGEAWAEIRPEDFWLF